MDKLNKKQKVNFSLTAIISIVIMLGIMGFEIYIPYTFNNAFIFIPLLISILVGFYSLFALLIDFPNTY